MTAPHNLVIEEGDLRFRCNAVPIGGKPPSCWFAYEYDDEGNEISRENLGECNVRMWLGEQGISTKGSVSIPVEVAWDGDNGPELVLPQRVVIDAPIVYTRGPCHP